MRKIILMLAFTVLITNSIYAGEGKASVVLDANQMKIQVNGIVCSFCSFGAQKNLSKLKFLNTSKFKKGVKVDIKNQQIYLALAEDKEINLKAIYDSIKKGGYEPVAIYLRVKGNIDEKSIIRDKEKQLLFHLESDKLPDSGPVEVQLHFDAKMIPSFSADTPIESSLDRIIE